MADKFPNLEGSWRSRPEVWAPALFGHWMGLEPLPQAQVAEAVAVLNQNPPNLGRLERGVSSWNWDWMIAAAQLWRPDGNKTDILLTWTTLLRAQAGTGTKRNTLLGKFEGAEPTSSTYTAWRVGSVLAVLHWCRTRTFPPDSVLARRTATVERAARRWLDIWCGIQALGMVPWPDRVGYRAANGNLWWRGPTPSPVGERSTHAYDPDQPALWALLVDWPAEQLRFQRTGWPTLVAQRVAYSAATARDLRTWVQKGTGLTKVLASLARVRLFGDQHWIRLPEGLLVYREQRLNNNSPTHLYSWAPDAAQTMTLGYPVAPGRRGRGSGFPQGGEAVLHEPPPRRFIEARIGDERRETDLPESRILSHVIGDEQGFRQALDVIVMPEEKEAAVGSRTGKR